MLTTMFLLFSEKALLYDGPLRLLACKLLTEHITGLLNTWPCSPNLKKQIETGIGWA